MGVWHIPMDFKILTIQRCGEEQSLYFLQTHSYYKQKYFLNTYFKHMDRIWSTLSYGEVCNCTNTTPISAFLYVFINSLNSLIVSLVFLLECRTSAPICGRNIYDIKSLTHSTLNLPKIPSACGFLRMKKYTISICLCRDW